MRLSKAPMLRTADKPVRGAGLVVLHGDDPGRLHTLTRTDSIIGSGPRSDIRIAGEGVEKSHARIGYGGHAVLLRDLESAHGTFVNGERVAEYELRHGDVVRVGRTLFTLIAGPNLAGLHREEIYRLATIDGLTQAYNRRYFVEQLERELGRCRRYGRRLTLGLLDLDGLGGVNRAHGRLAGDQLLAETAALIRSRIRREDLFGRLEGGEFALALPEISLPQGMAVGDKLRRLIGERELRLGGRAISLTISMGLLEYRGKTVEAAALLRQVDVKLSEAKRRGRNRVCV